MEKKFKIAIMFSGRRRRSRQERNRLVKADVTQVIVYMYFRDFFALKPLRYYSLCSVCILPRVCSPHSAFCTQPAFYSQSAVCILHSVCILPLVRSLHSAVCVLHWLIGNPISDGIVFKNELTLFPLLEAFKEGWKVSSDSGLTWWPSGAASQLVSLSNYCPWCVFCRFPEVRLSLCELSLYTCSL